jgi:DNA anti-recombination protein RmuC
MVNTENSMTMTTAVNTNDTNIATAPSSHTSKDLSYDRESQTNDLLSPMPSNHLDHHNESADPPTQIPSSTNEPKPTVTTSNFVPSPLVDPVIHQLQQSLSLMTARINTIEETTTQRFTSIQDQFTQSQLNIANILKEGLKDMQMQ